jgi:hypothetical protein
MAVFRSATHRAEERAVLLLTRTRHAKKKTRENRQHTEAPRASYGQSKVIDCLTKKHTTSTVKIHRQKKEDRDATHADTRTAHRPSNSERTFRPGSPWFHAWTRVIRTCWEAATDAHMHSPWGYVSPTRVNFSYTSNHARAMHVST